MPASRLENRPLVSSLGAAPVASTLRSGNTREYYTDSWKRVTPYAIPGVDRRDGVERDLDRVGAAWD